MRLVKATLDHYFFCQSAYFYMLALPKITTMCVNLWSKVWVWYNFALMIITIMFSGIVTVSFIAVGTVNPSIKIWGRWCCKWIVLIKSFTLLKCVGGFSVPADVSSLAWDPHVEHSFVVCSFWYSTSILLKVDRIFFQRLRIMLKVGRGWSKWFQ